MIDDKISRRDFLITALRTLLALLLLGGVGELIHRNGIRCEQPDACVKCSELAKCPIRKKPLPVAEKRQERP